MIWFKSKEHIAALVTAGIATLALITSFYKTDAEVYLFPRIAAVIITLLAVTLIIKVIKNTAKTVNFSDSLPKLIKWKTLLPGLAVGFIYLFLLEVVGFYVTSFFAYFAICVIYGRCDMTNRKRGIFKLVVSTIFMIVLFLLFWNLLHVRTPTGWLI
ncbi:tripartite tricarboxylate transporter TctB family protein [Cocleimonas sp. KMM 6892]|uniref:tripartite tricarboxylate transporter TctB family protein n=1 Tax=unclassified Cocleimonas TaxID=2639732 RepID=UPI002DB8268E|nr:MULTISPECIES: tripartite tricarboxylate transporter TctB family protein [unclassified Cocleimonas]MEB8431954.1 tripartite tricarboxylate transporter TctB family protein [Cocleimonas sp. KMM 6892]MEC4714960.1 tripartite tricarboxylate transporter TctB family protein [Cocleimonas sp. KMM 6895]MEC4744226.1 tripartite tricarboxylate transporter TctB family protein [Cocleimonas sp. KMM 6896]